MAYNTKLIKTEKCYVNDLKVKIQLYEFYDNVEGKTMYFAKTDYKNITAINDSIKKTLNDCKEKIKAKEIMLNKKCYSDREGLNIAQEKFYEHFKNRKISKAVSDRLSYSWGRDVNILTISVLYNSENEIKVDGKKTFPQIMVTIVVDLISGECTIYESDKIKW